MDSDPDDRDFLPEIGYTPMSKPRSSFQPPVKTKKKPALAEAPFFRMSGNKYLMKTPVIRTEEQGKAKLITSKSSIPSKSIPSKSIPSRQNPVQHNKQEKKKVNLSGRGMSSKKGSVLERMLKMETLLKENESSVDSEESRNVMRKRKLSSSPESTFDDSDADPDYKEEKEKESLSDSESESKTAKKQKLMPKKFKCEECGKWFNEIQRLSDHKMNVHPKVRPKPNRSNRNLKEKRNHVNPVTNPVYCGSSELPRSELSITMDNKKELPKDGKQSVRQGQYFVRQQSFKGNHEVLNPATPNQNQTPPLETGSPLLENETPSSCVSCGRGFINLGALLNHSKACMKTYTCKLCKVNFKKLKYLKIHVKQKHMAGQIPCEHCEMKFNSHAKLNRHLKSLLTPSSKCNVCEKVFKNANVLKVHKSKIHNKKKQSKSVEVWQCNLCPKVYQSERGLRGHKVIHKKFADQDQENVESVSKEEVEQVCVEEKIEEVVEVDSSNIVINDFVDYIIS